MQTQKYLREVIDLPVVDEASGPYFTQLALYRRMFMDNGMFESEWLEDALQVCESFHVLEALLSRWSTQNFFVQMQLQHLLPVCVMPQCFAGEYGM